MKERSWSEAGRPGFRSNRQLWAYAGLALITRTSADYRLVQGSLQRSRKPNAIRGLNQNHNHDLKEIFKSAALRACRLPGPWRDCFTKRIEQGMKPELARLIMARKRPSFFGGRENTTKLRS